MQKGRRLQNPPHILIMPPQSLSCEACDFCSEQQSGDHVCLLCFYTAATAPASSSPHCEQHVVHPSFTDVPTPPPLSVCPSSSLQIVAAILAIAGIVMMTYADGFHSHSVIGITLVVASASMSALYKVFVCIQPAVRCRKSCLCRTVSFAMEFLRKCKNSLTFV